MKSKIFLLILLLNIVDIKILWTMKKEVLPEKLTHKAQEVSIPFLTTDGDTIWLKNKLVRNCGTIVHILNDLEEIPDEAIPLQNISTKMLTILKSYLKKSAKKEFCDAQFDQYSTSKLLKIMKAANYLDYEELLSGCASHLAKEIRKKATKPTMAHAIQFNQRINTTLPLELLCLIKKLYIEENQELLKNLNKKSSTTELKSKDITYRPQYLADGRTIITTNNLSIALLECS